MAGAGQHIADCERRQIRRNARHRSTAESRPPASSDTPARRLTASTATTLVNAPPSTSHLARVALFRGQIAGDNPWNAPTLEWAAASPPESYNFRFLPTVRSAWPLWKDDPETTPVVTGLSATTREVLTTSLMDARPEYRYELAIDSLWPFLLAVVLGITFVGLIFHPYALPIGLVAGGIVLSFWFWRDQELKVLTDNTKGGHPEHAEQVQA